MKKFIVVSLGGSQIIKNNMVNVNYLNKFKKVINNHKKKYKFVIVTGGGSIARMYISGLNGKSEKLQNFAGISVTRTNARFMSYFFGKDCTDGIPNTMKELKKMLKNENPVFTGALEYHRDQTSDSTSAQIASEFKAEFINLTNVSGLYDKNPLKYKDANLIKEISWKDFHKIASKIPFKPGQHFVLDQKASEIIMREKIKTYIIGGNLVNLDLILMGKKFNGTSIYG